GRAQLHDLADVECAVGGLLCDGFVDGWLESLDVEGDVGLTDLADLSAGQLQVVRLRSGLGELNDRDLVTTDLLGQPLQGVDTGDHGEVRIGGGDARVVRCVAVVSAGREGCECRGDQIGRASCRERGGGAEGGGGGEEERGRQGGGGGGGGAE